MLLTVYIQNEVNGGVRRREMEDDYDVADDEG